MHKLFLSLSAISGMIAVSLGAFGAHALKDRLMNAGYWDTYQTAVFYQFIHTLALLAIGILATRVSSPYLHYAGYGMTGGILIFSGSLYLLCFTGQKWLGAITPIGGLLFIAGWAFLLFYSLKSS